ncbi:MAG: ATP-binding protein, partial [Myxococcales bacterium]|nr:ATP-binding protein [Myxococcales bacterium]
EHRLEVHGDDALVITSYPGAIAQLITNLLMNALTHAFAPGVAGTITIRLTRANGRIWLDFADDGRGIPPENLERIFEPFFTTGRDRGGSGLGLHIVYNLVSQTLGGTIRCESEVGRGTRFVVELPAEAGDAGAAG